MNTFNFLEAKRHFKLDIGCRISIVCKFIVVVEAIFLVAKAKSLMPAHTSLFPLLEPFKFFTWTNKELHFHLFEFTHTENELTSHDFVTEGLANLGDTERNAHTACLLNIQEVNKDSLCCFRTQIHRHRAIGSAAHLGFEHQVKLANFSPVASATNRTHYFIVENNLT